MNETESDPQGDMVIGYDRTAAPRTVSLVLSHEPRHPVGRLLADRDRFRFEPIV